MCIRDSFMSDLTSYTRGTRGKDKRVLLKKSVKTLNPHKKPKNKEYCDISLVMNTPVMIGGVSTITDSPMLGSRSTAFSKGDEPGSPNSFNILTKKQTPKADNSLVKLAIYNSMSVNKSPEMGSNALKPMNKFFRVRSKTGVHLDSANVATEILDDHEPMRVNPMENMMKLNSMTLNKHPSILNNDRHNYAKYKTDGGGKRLGFDKASPAIGQRTPTTEDEDRESVKR
eukprot:TRINITY_DN987_c0_g2_i2.p1 TRINITY_DN987_c0_g2~~TRINITY_DN987_c0_g2_i2.p1  ORF type:complete len:228 (+),score=23.96 TRINITY_DN987_c0_g2_i2:69-752(+)